MSLWLRECCYQWISCRDNNGLNRCWMFHSWRIIVIYIINTVRFHKNIITECYCVFITNKYNAVAFFFASLRHVQEVFSPHQYFVPSLVHLARCVRWWHCPLNKIRTNSNHATVVNWNIYFDCYIIISPSLTFCCVLFNYSSVATESSFYTPIIRKSTSSNNERCEFGFISALHCDTCKCAVFTPLHRLRVCNIHHHT